jgi:hypothetical protein
VHDEHQILLGDPEGAVGDTFAKGGFGQSVRRATAAAAPGDTGLPDGPDGPDSVDEYIVLARGRRYRSRTAFT